MNPNNAATRTYTFTELECSDSLQFPATIRDGNATCVVTRSDGKFRATLTCKACGLNSHFSHRLHDEMIDTLYDHFFEHSERCY